MQDFLPFIVIGLATGAVYGLAGVGLVLAYKTSGIFNLAYGAIAALTVFVFYWLHDEHGWPWGLAAAVCVLVLGPAEGLLMELLGRALERVGATLKVVATVGLLLIVLGVGELWYGNNEVNFPPFLPTSTVPILGVNVGWDQITVTIISVVATAVLYYFFRYVRMGFAIRGVVDNPDLLSMTGENPIRVRRWAWVISMTFCSMAGLLLAPGLSLNAEIISTLVVYAFGAAAIGYFSSLPLTFVGGLLIGIAGSLATKYAVSVSWLSGLPPAIPFIVLFVALVVTPKARLAERRVVTTLPVRKAWYAPWRVRLAVVRRGHRRSVPCPEPGGRPPGHLGEFPGGCHPAAFARPARAHLGSDLALPPRVRGGRRRGIRALRGQLPHAVAARTPVGHAGRRAGRGHRLDPGHPAVRLVPGARHAGLRDPPAVSLLLDQLDVRADDGGDPGSAAPGERLRSLAGVGQGLLLRAAGRGSAEHTRDHGDPAQQDGTPPRCAS